MNKNLNFVKLSDNVYIVDGAARSAIYDLNYGNLYSLNNSAIQFVKTILGEGYDANDVSTQALETINHLLEAEILMSCLQPVPIKDILSLKQDRKLSFAWIEVTRKCNLSCSFCYEGSNPHCVERMSINDFKLVLENLIEAGITRIQFIGGEPTILKDDLKEMIRLAREHFEFIEVYSNGILIDDTWCEFFKEYNIQIALSIHSYNSHEHDRVTCVKGSHRKVERALKLIKKYKIPHRIGTVSTSSCKVGKPNAETSYKLRPSLPKVTGRADLDSYNYEMFKQKAITRKSKTYPLKKNQVIMALSGHQCFIRDIYINSLMEVYPCVMERRISHGNIRQRRLTDIINNDIRHLNKDNIEGCKNCEYRYACFDCRPDSNGNKLYSKPWYCSYDPSQGKWHDLTKMFHHLKGKNKLAAIPVKITSSLSET